MTPPATTSPAHLHARVQRSPPQRPSGSQEGSSADTLASEDEGAGEQQLGSFELYPALLQPPGDGTDRGSDIAIIRCGGRQRAVSSVAATGLAVACVMSCMHQQQLPCAQAWMHAARITSSPRVLDELPPDESAHLNNKGKRALSGHAAAAPQQLAAASNAAIKLHVGTLADGTLTIEVRHVPLTMRAAAERRRRCCLLRCVSPAHAAALPLPLHCLCVRVCAGGAVPRSAAVAVPE